MNVHFVGIGACASVSTRYDWFASKCAGPPDPPPPPDDDQDGGFVRYSDRFLAKSKR